MYAVIAAPDCRGLDLVAAWFLVLILYSFYRFVLHSANPVDSHSTYRIVHDHILLF